MRKRRPAGLNMNSCFPAHDGRRYACSTHQRQAFPMVRAVASSAGPVGADQGQLSCAGHWTRPHGLLIDLAAAFLCVLPLLLTAHIPLTDLPNHLARQYIIRDIASSPILQNYYVVHWSFVPNLALELFVLPVRHVMSLDLAVRFFCIATMLLLFFGSWLVNGV